MRHRSTSVCNPAHMHTFIARNVCRFQSHNQFVSLFCRGHLNWLQLDRRVLEHDFPKKSGPVVLYFCVRYVRWLSSLLPHFFLSEVSGREEYLKGNQVGLGLLRGAQLRGGAAANVGCECMRRASVLTCLCSYVGGLCGMKIRALNFPFSRGERAGSGILAQTTLKFLQ